MGEDQYRNLMRRESWDAGADRWAPQAPIILAPRRRRSRSPVWALLILIALYFLAIFVGIPMLIAGRP